MVKKTNNGNLHMTCPSCAGSGVVHDAVKFGQHLRDLRSQFTVCGTCGYFSRKKFTICRECGESDKRKVGKMSVEKAGSLVGISRQYVSTLERGWHKLSNPQVAETARMLEKALRQA